jgi:hypothetical protein
MPASSPRDPGRWLSPRHLPTTTDSLAAALAAAVRWASSDDLPEAPATPAPRAGDAVIAPESRHAGSPSDRAPPTTEQPRAFTSAAAPPAPFAARASARSPFASTASTDDIAPALATVRAGDEPLRALAPSATADATVRERVASPSPGGIHIGTVEVQIIPGPPPPAPAPLPRSAPAAAPARLARGLTSSIGLRQS